MSSLSLQITSCAHSWQLRLVPSFIVTLSCWILCSQLADILILLLVGSIWETFSAYTASLALLGPISSVQQATIWLSQVGCFYFPQPDLCSPVVMSSVMQSKKNKNFESKFSSRLIRWHDVEALSTSPLLELTVGPEMCCIAFAFIAIRRQLLTWPVEHSACKAHVISRRQLLMVKELV